MLQQRSNTEQKRGLTYQEINISELAFDLGKEKLDAQNSMLVYSYRRLDGILKCADDTIEMLEPVADSNGRYKSLKRGWWKW